MNKINDKSKQSKSLKIIWHISLFLCMAIIIVYTILWDYYAVWAYFNTPVFAQKTEQFSPAQTKKPTPSPTKLKTPKTSASSEITPQPTPAPHPGDRDNKFTQGEIEIGDWSYHSQDISIEINKFYEDEITYFTAEVYVRDMDNFLAVFAGDKYGLITDKTSNMAKENNAIFAVSGDYYNARGGGIVIRNSILYREKIELEKDILAIYNDSFMEGFYYKDTDASQLIKDGVVHTYVFGPLLVDDKIEAMEFSDRNKTIRHPRCAIGMVEPYHYYFILADGRKQGYSIGMTLYELAQKFIDLGCEVAYNLDGGGSATMIFMDELVNLPQGTTKQRGIGDAICFIEIE